MLSNHIREKPSWWDKVGHTVVDWRDIGRSIRFERAAATATVAVMKRAMELGTVA